MDQAPVHEIELYFHDAFKTLLEHEVNRSRRYKNPLAHARAVRTAKAMIFSEMKK